MGFIVIKLYVIFYYVGCFDVEYVLIGRVVKLIKVFGFFDLWILYYSGF